MKTRPIRSEEVVALVKTLIKKDILPPALVLSGSVERGPKGLVFTVVKARSKGTVLPDRDTLILRKLKVQLPELAELATATLVIGAELGTATLVIGAKRAGEEDDEKSDEEGDEAVAPAASPAAVVASERAVLASRGQVLKQRMNAQLGPDVDRAAALVALRALMVDEFQRSDTAAALVKRASAQGLPLEPSPAGVAFAENTSAEATEWSEGVCFEAFKRYTWFDFKALRRSGRVVEVPGVGAQTRITDEVMWKLYQYRRHWVDAKLKELHGRYRDPGLLFKSGGSEDIESDLDITVASPRSGDDVKAMREFNDAVEAAFGRPPGRVFDTNLYARDYGAIKDTMTKDREAAAPVDHAIAEPVDPAIALLARMDQDVATLMKQRRYMDGETYTDMWESLFYSFPPGADRARVKQRFEEGEAVYLLTSVQKVDAIVAKVEAFRERSGAVGGEALDWKGLDRELGLYRDAKGRDDRVAAQDQIPKLLDFLEDSFPDQVMSATDKLYADRMDALRFDQGQTLSFEARLQAHAAADETCEKLHPRKEHAKWAKQMALAVDGLRARAKQAQFTNILFANEAYVSQGAITHVVAGTQASTPEEKRAVLERIQPSELLQSTNEQLADFLKDMRQMEHGERRHAPDATARRRASGEAFVHASKYLSRMLDAASMLQDKYAANPEALDGLTSPPFELCARAHVDSPIALKAVVDGVLLKLRKSSTIPGDVKAEIAHDEVLRVFQVEDVAGFRALFTAFCIDFNKRVRHLPDFLASQVVYRDAERAYFGAPPPEAPPPEAP